MSSHGFKFPLLALPANAEQRGLVRFLPSLGIVAISILLTFLDEPIRSIGLVLRGLLAGWLWMVRGKPAPQPAQQPSESHSLTMADAQATAATVLDSAPLDIVITDMEGQICLANEYLLRRMGRTLSQVVGKNLYEAGCIPTSRWDEMLQTIREHERFEADEIRVRKPDGTERDIALYATRFQVGTQSRIMWMATDISERIAAQRKLVESESQFREYFELGLVGFAISGRDRRLQCVNMRLCEMTGYGREQLLGMDWATITHPADLAGELERFEQILSGEREGFSYDKRYIRRDGETLHLSVSVRGVKNSAGEVDHLLTVMQDITPRKKIEQRLHEKNSVLEAIFRTAPVGLSFARNRVLMDVSDEYCEIFGYTKAELVGKSTQLLYPSQDAYQEAGDILYSLESWKHGLELTLKRKDGSQFVAHFRCAPLDENDPMDGMLVAIVDITQRVEQERELKEALERARAAIASKDRFLAAASHELRTPLTPILLIASSLGDDRTVPAEIREELQTIRENVEVEKRLITALLDFSAIQAGGMPVNLRRDSVHPCIRNAVNQVKADYAEKNVRLELKLTEEADLAEIDPQRLTATIFHVLHNGVKYTPSGGTVTLTTQRNLSGDIVILVQDTGIGLLPNQLEKLFEPFEYAPHRETMNNGGLGLGLAIARATVAAMHGTITASSAGRDQGTCITITLPPTAN